MDLSGVERVEEIETVQGQFIFDSTVPLDKKCIGTGSWLPDKNLWEKDLIEMVHNSLKDKTNPVIVDVGANCGSYALLAIKHSQMKVLAFEPQPNTFQFLTNNIKLNGVEDRVTVLPYAVGEHEAELDLKSPTNDHQGLCTLGDTPKRFNQWKTFKVKQIACDLAFCEKHGIDHVDFIKIDTEGWEVHVLKGMTDMIMKYRPHLLLEIWSQNLAQCGLNECDLYTVLVNLRYTWKLVSHEDLYCTPL